MVWQLNSQGKKNCKSTESFCHIILVIYTMIGPLFDMFDAAMLICFSGKVVNEWKPRTTLYPYWQPGPPGLASMLTKLQACFSVPCDQKLSCKLNLSSFKAVPPNRLSFYLGRMFHIISSPFSYFNLVYRFPQYVCSWIERNKILISQLSLPKFKYLWIRLDQRGTPRKWILTISKCKYAVPKQIGLKKQMKKWGY